MDFDILSILLIQKILPNFVPWWFKIINAVFVLSPVFIKKVSTEHIEHLTSNAQWGIAPFPSMFGVECSMLNVFYFAGMISAVRRVTGPSRPDSSNGEFLPQ